MGGITFFFFTISVLFLVGMFYNISRHLKPGIFPPKRVLKQRVKLMGCGGLIFAILGFIFLLLTN